MYKISSEEKQLIQIKKITSEKYSKNKVHTLCIYKKITDEVYIICVSMTDLQKSLDLQNSCHLATQKMESYRNTKNPTKDQVKKCERKVKQWIYDDKSLYWWRSCLKFNSRQ